MIRRETGIYAIRFTPDETVSRRTGFGTVVPTPGGALPSPAVMPLPTSVTVAAEQARQDQAVAQEMWTRDASAPYVLEYAGRVVSRDLNRPWQPGDERNPIVYDKIVCDWSVAIVNAVCSPDVVRRWLLESDRFNWAKRRLARLLEAKARMPALTRTTATMWAEWLRDVLRLVALAYWSIGVRNHYPFLPGPDGTMAGAQQTRRSWLAWDGPFTQRFAERYRVAVRAAFGARIAGDRFSSTRGVVENPTGYNFARLWDRLLPKLAWNVVSDGGPVPKNESAFDAPMFVDGLTSSYVSYRTRRPGSTNVNDWSPFQRPASAPLDNVAQWLSDTAEFTWGTRPLVVDASYMRVRDSRGVLQPPLEGPSFAGQGLIDAAEAQALDVLASSYDGLVLEGLLRWKEDIARMPDYVLRSTASSREAVDRALAQNRELANERERQATAGQQALIGAGTSGSQSGAAVGTVFVQFLSTVAQMIIAGSDVAVGASSIPFCPPPPLLRVMPQVGCDIAALVRQMEAEPMVDSPGRAFFLRPIVGTPPIAFTPPARGGSVIGVGALLALLGYFFR